MNRDQAKKEIIELIEDGYTIQSVLYLYYHMFVTNVITYQELSVYIDILGYDFTDEFKKNNELVLGD